MNENGTHESLYLGPLTPEQRTEIKEFIKTKPETNLPYSDWMSRFNVSETSINAYLVLLVLDNRIDSE